MAPVGPQAVFVDLPEIVQEGNGPTTLLIIPCMSCRWRSWDTFLERNRARYRMYAVTLPGFGGTPRPDLPLNTDGTPWRDNALEALSRLIDREELQDVVVIGQSFGTMVGVQLAALRPDRVARLINVDGSLVNPVPKSREEQLQAASDTVMTQSARFSDAEEWRTFNGGGNTLRPPATEPIMERQRSILYHGMFMATDKTALLQYWRENLLIDLTAALKTLTIPILDIQSFRSGDYAEQRRQYEELLVSQGAPAQIETVFLNDTSHFVMEHRPELTDRLIAAFIAGGPVAELVPSELR